MGAYDSPSQPRMNDRTGALLSCCRPDHEENTYISFPFGGGEGEEPVRTPIFGLTTDRELESVVTVSGEGNLRIEAEIPAGEARLILNGRHSAEVMILTPLSSDEKKLCFSLSRTECWTAGKRSPGAENRECRVILETMEEGRYHRYLLVNRTLAGRNAALQKERLISGSFSWAVLSGPKKQDAQEGQESIYISARLNKDGRWSVESGDRDFILAKGVQAHLHRLSFSGSRLTLWIETDETISPCKGIFLRFRSKLKEERVRYRFGEAGRAGKKRRYELDLSGIPLKSLYWDVVAEFEEPGSACPFFSFVTMTYRYRFFVTFFYPGQYRTPDGFMFYAYNTSAGMLAFKYREKEEYDSWGFRFRETAAFVIFSLGKRYWKKHPVRLVYEKLCVMAQDNGYYFFRYCMDNGVEKRQGVRYYYVIDKKSPDCARLASYRNRVIPFLSLRHMICIQAADLLVTTDTRSHLYPSKGRASLVRRDLRKKPVVFLQHGVTALKKVDFFYGKGKSGACDLFVVTSDFEKEIVKKYFGYTEEEIVNSGFARWDVLEDRSREIPGRRRILIMPSWRVWLENSSPEEFEKSSYYRNYMELLNSGRFQRLLQDYDLEAEFYLHSLFRKFISGFEVHSDRIRLISFGEIPANELLMECSLLVTDYSSVCWDVFYQGKPVLFFQFDRGLYLEAHGSYLDMEKELFGPCAGEVNGLLDHMERCAASGFALEEKYARMQKSFFPVTDDQNSRRICDAIERRWPART